MGPVETEPSEQCIDGIVADRDLLKLDIVALCKLTSIVLFDLAIIRFEVLMDINNERERKEVTT